MAHGKKGRKKLARDEETRKARARDSRLRQSYAERTISCAPASWPVALVLGGVLSPFRGSSRATGVKLSPPWGRARSARSVRSARSQKRKRVAKETPRERRKRRGRGRSGNEEDEEEATAVEIGSREGIGVTRRGNKSVIDRKLTAIPTGSCRPPYSSMGLGSREAQAKEHRAPHRRAVTKYRAEPGTEQTDDVCGPSHPGRSLNGLRVEGRKEGGGGGRAEPRQLEFLRRKDRAEKRVPSLGLPRRATSRAHSLRLARFPRR